MISYLIAFDSPHEAIRAEQILATFSGRLIPTPTEVNASCGLSFLGGDIDQLTEALHLCHNLGLVTAKAYGLYTENCSNGQKECWKEIALV